MVTLTRSHRLTVAVVTVTSALVGLGGVADAATTGHHHRKHSKRHSTARSASGTTAGTYPTSSSTSGRPDNPEVELTGDTADKAKAAALAAVPGGTVWRASTEDPSDPSGAAYEVHVTKADGSEVEVLLDSSFNVVKIQDSPQKAGGRGGHGGCDGDGPDGQSQSGAAGTYPSGT